MSGSITKTIRIRAVDLPKIESAMSEKGLTWSGAVHYLLSSGVGGTDRELERYKQKFGVLSARVRKEADKYFKNEQYTMLEIVPVGYHKTQSGCGSLPKDLYDHIMSMVNTYGMSYEEFMKVIDHFLDECYITDDGGELKTIDSKLNTSGFISKCDEFGIKDYQSAFDKLVKTMKTN